MTSENSKSLEFLGYSNYYITTDGMLYSSHYKRFLTPFIIKKGYHRYILQQDKNKDEYLVHQLVALAFIPNPNNYETVDHIDNNPNNNNVINLQWMSNEDNVRKSWESGNHDHQKKSVLQILNDEIVAKHDSIADAGRALGIHYSGISRACKYGRKCKGFYWRIDTI